MGIKIWNTDISKIKIASGLTPRLPSAYQEVEYIQTTWQQWIDTWLFASNDYQVETLIETASAESEKCIFWSLSNTTTSDSWYYYNLINYLTKFYWGINWTEDSWWSFPSTAWVQYEIVFNDVNGQVVVDNTVIWSCNWVVWYTWSTLCLNARWWTNQRYYGKYKFFYFKIYDKVNSEYVMDMIPCYRISDGVIWMYDLINDAFYTKSGSWDLLKGSNVNSPYKSIKKVYLGSTQIRPTWWQPWANTVCYFPLESDFVDVTSNQYTLTWYNWAVIWNLNGVNCLDLTSSGSYLEGTVSWLPQWANVRTNMFRVYWTSTWSKPPYQYWQSWLYKWDVIYTNNPISWSNYWWTIWTVSATTWTWYHVAVTIDGSTSQSVYINWQLANSGTEIVNTTWDTLYLWRCIWDYTYLWGYLGDFIVEDRVWTAQEVEDYYNLTKWKYWIS